MKNRFFAFNDAGAFEKELVQFSNWCKENGSPTVCFQIHSAILDPEKLKPVWDILEKVFSDVPWFGNSTSGNIVNCEKTGDISVSAIIFEKPTTKFKIHQYDFSQKSINDIANEIVKEANHNPWVKAVEIYHCIAPFSTTHLCEGLDSLAPHIQIFGGIVCSPDITSPESCVFSSVGGYTKTGLLVVFYGGEEFFVESRKISGWKPIGRNFHVTRSKGNVLYELSSLPAYEVYNKYLNIKNDNNFFYNALEFPMLYEHNGISIVRAAGASNPDGSLTMSSDIDEGSIVRLSYGEPQLIVEKIRAESESAELFAPEVMHIFSCAARKAFWSQHEPTYEITPFKNLATSTGFFSHGEFLREKGHLNQHNITLVIASMREGPIVRNEDKKIEHISEKSTRLPLAARMATFISETSFELEQINSKLRVMNEHLQDVATTDSLTGLENRLAFDALLDTINQEQSKTSNWTMLLMDVNGLKYANDTFGHQAGDALIVAAANAIKGAYGTTGNCFRIGGDEFVVVMRAPLDSLFKLQRQLRRGIEEYNKTALYHLSIAVGESRLCSETGIRKSISDWKMEADLNMYRDKVRYHKSSESNENQNLKDLISCLISVEEAKDSYTAHHSDRVKAYSELIARFLGLSESSISLITNAAHLHDIGKIGIQDNVLTKPGKLTDEEFDIIKQHPVIGAKILMQSNYTHEMVQIVLHHHERFDGRGYPEGLKGEDIPIGARVIAIADSIDAMTSKRVYRDAMSLDYCRNEIEKNLGKMYDPAIGKVVLEHWNEMVDSLLSMRSGRPKVI
ncbi:HD domain-containing phosphohydrolase [Fibrobacter sp. UWB11]|uniref:HD domain-containing phosphohydrolase n=1 Tax=Fibrobacter sp. UWB11 TaxID=1896202 RepID=UPI000926928B|nr:HD domain-containing phosphohydrolase [Fibrobacter sp. UWB11]SIO46168.1 diguanylate cyclase (GGDEF) domain-containing protein/HDIG domain-containing protein [Fibrobacter sp. UWB11]